MDVKRKRVSLPVGVPDTQIGGIPDVANGELLVPPQPDKGNPEEIEEVEEVEEEEEEVPEPPKKKASPGMVRHPRMPFHFEYVCPCQRFNSENPEGSYFYWCNFHQRKITNMFA